MSDRRVPLQDNMKLPLPRSRKQMFSYPLLAGVRATQWLRPSHIPDRRDEVDALIAATTFTGDGAHPPRQGLEGTGAIIVDP